MSRQWPVSIALMLLFEGSGCATPAPNSAPTSAARADATAAKAGVAEDAMRGVFADALQGDGRGAVAAMKRIDPAALSEKYRSLRTCMLERLDARMQLPITQDDRVLAGVLSAYREYWMRSLRAEHAAGENEAALLAALNTFATANGGKRGTTLDELEPVLTDLIQARGWHALFGMTLPLREFMLWNTETRQHYEVQLPQAVQPVTVVFMDDFASLGWAGFATCERLHSGGWTRPEALYAVRSAYDLGSEDFRVSYLAHEAQHFWDHEHFPDLEQPELEYRAKLVELATAKTGVHALLDAFAGNVGNDRAVPHSFANGRIVHDLRAQLFGGNAATPWTQASAARINAVAKDLLRSDGARLAAAQAMRAQTPKAG